MGQEKMRTAFVVVHHSILNIPKQATFQWSPGFTRQAKGELIKNVDMWSLIKQSIEGEMQRQGYRHIEQAEQADINICFTAVLQESLRDAQIAQRYGLVPGLMTHNIDQHRYQKGTVIFDVVNPHSGQLVWRTAGQALASLENIPQQERNTRINIFVKKLLAFLAEK